MRRQERGLGDARATRKEGEVWLSLIRAGPSRVTNVWGPSILRRGEGRERRWGVEVEDGVEGGVVVGRGC